MSEKARDIFIERLREDLVGPSGGENEEISERPVDRYLTGIIYPQSEHMTEEDDEKLEIEAGEAVQEGESGTEISISRSFKPATAGISFSLFSEENLPNILVVINCGVYNPYWVEDEGKQHIEKPNDKTTKTKWKRTPVSITLPLKIALGTSEIDLTGYGLSGIFLFVKATKYNNAVTLTLQTYNSNTFEQDTPYYEKERAALFQFKLKVLVQEGTIFFPRPVHSYVSDEDSSIAALIYRDTKEYATGHTCSAIWSKDEQGTITSVETEWLPQQKVHSVEPAGDIIFNEKFKKKCNNFPFSKIFKRRTKG